jgi:hypothetical protein
VTFGGSAERGDAVLARLPGRTRFRPAQLARKTSEQELERGFDRLGMEAIERATGSPPSERQRTHADRRPPIVARAVRSMCGSFDRRVVPFRRPDGAC